MPGGFYAAGTYLNPALFWSKELFPCSLNVSDITLYCPGCNGRIGDNDDEMWDEKDGFFYDLLCMPDGEALRLKTSIFSGTLPLCASSIFEANHFTKNPRFAELLIQLS